MTMKHGRTWIAAGSLAAGLLCAVQVARSGGVPTTPLTYAGFLQEDGSPADGNVTMSFALYGSASGGSPTCSVGPLLVNVQGGRFAVDLGADCRAALQDSPDQWVETSVGGGALPRVKVGSVPYAIEAERASTLSVDCAVGEVLTKTATGWGCGVAAAPAQGIGWADANGSVVPNAVGLRDGTGGTFVFDGYQIDGAGNVWFLDGSTGSTEPLLPSAVVEIYFPTTDCSGGAMLKTDDLTPGVTFRPVGWTTVLARPVGSDPAPGQAACSVLDPLGSSCIDIPCVSGPVPWSSLAVTPPTLNVVPPLHPVLMPM